MIPQDRGGRHGADRSIETGFDGSRLARPRNHSENFPSFKNLAHGHGDSLCGNGVEIFKPAFGDLLRAAGVVERDDDVWLFRLEIGGGIVERNMSIFAD